jgi:phosphatidylglycerophosphatase A
MSSTSAHRSKPVAPPPALSPAARGILITYTSGFGAGYAPVASGTFGTLPGVVLFLIVAPLNQWGWGMVGYLAIAAVLFAVAVPAASLAERIHGGTDCGKIVIDEIVGFLVTMTLVPLHWAWVLGGFVAFRFFDVLKPWPGNKWQNLSGGMGVMIDDVVAGLYACVSLHLAFALVHWLGWPAFALVG